MVHVHTDFVEMVPDLFDDLSKREKLIDQYEQEIRKRHNQVEKKQLYVDRLNRDYDDKRSKLSAELGDGGLEP